MKNPVFHKKSKHINTRFCRFRPSRSITVEAKNNIENTYELAEGKQK
jgi:hypothetical protein